MALTEEEKSRTRHHCGYTQVTAIATFFAGIPQAIQPLYMLEEAMNLLMPSGEEMVRHHLRILDAIETLDVQNLSDVEAAEVGEVSLDPKFYEKRWKQYRRWQGSLCNILGVLPNSYDFRNAVMGGQACVPRMHG